MWRQSYIAVGAAALLGTGGCGTRHQTAADNRSSVEGAEAKAGSAKGSPLPDLTLHGVAFARLSGGLVVASGAADELRYHRAGGRFEASGGRARLFPGPGAAALGSLGEVALTAPAVEGDLLGRIATASGGVDAVAERGDTARTERATFDGKGRVVRGDRPVEASGPGYTLRGKSFVARTDGSRVQLAGGAGGTLVPATARARPPGATP